MSGTPIAGDYVKAQGKSGRMGARLMAIVVDGEHGRTYLSPTAAMEAIGRKAEPDWKPEVTISGSTQYLGVKPYGMERFDQLFTNRQLVALATFSDLVQKGRERVKRDGLDAGVHNDGEPHFTEGNGAMVYADAVAMYLAFSVSKALDRNTTLCTWEHRMNRVTGTCLRVRLSR